MGKCPPPGWLSGGRGIPRGSLEEEVSSLLVKVLVLGRARERGRGSVGPLPDCGRKVVFFPGAQRWET